MRRPEIDDHPVIYQWRNDPSNKPWFVDEEPISLESHLAWYERMVTDPSERFYVVDALVEPEGLERLAQPLLIGTTGLCYINWRNRTADYTRLLIGRTIYRGHGFGKEIEFLLMDYAFNYLNLHKMGGGLFSYNEAALALHAWLGFKKEGLLREQIFKGGTYRDLVIIGLLADEFRERERSLREELNL